MEQYLFDAENKNHNEYLLNNVSDIKSSNKLKTLLELQNFILSKKEQLATEAKIYEID
ncbi:MAG: hypothetical protein Q8S84_08285 [bacterium]|nr:hypothetical protein [bacterium]